MTNSNTNSPSDSREADYVYIGIQPTTTVKYGYFYKNISTGDVKGYRIPLVKSLSVGTVIRVQESADGRILKNTPVVIGQYEDRQAVMEWVALDSALKVEREIERRNRRVAATSIDPLHEAINTINSVIHSTSRSQQNNLLAYIISRLG